MKTIAILIVIVASIATQTLSEHRSCSDEMFGTMEAFYPNNSTKYVVNTVQRFAPMEVIEGSEIRIPSGSYVGAVWELRPSFWDDTSIDMSQNLANPIYFKPTLGMISIIIENNTLKSAVVVDQIVSLIKENSKRDACKSNHIALYELTVEGFNVSHLLKDSPPRPVLYFSLPEAN